MAHRLWLVVGLAVLVAGQGACSLVGPSCGPYQSRVVRKNALWTADREVGVATVDGRCMPPRCWPLMANYGTKMNNTEEFFGTYLFNYDPHDPYRGNDLGEMGNFVGTYFLNYNSCDPTAGDCKVNGYYCNPCSPNQPGPGN